MKTIEELNKLTKSYWVYFSFKKHWYYWQWTDRLIQRFEYNNENRTLYARFSDGKEVFVSWSKEYCISKAIEEINIHKAIGSHCLYADPL